MFPVLLQENDLIFVLHAGHLEARHLERDSKLLDLRPQLLDVLVLLQVDNEILVLLASLLLDVQADFHGLVKVLGNLHKVLLNQASRGHSWCTCKQTVYNGEISW